ncbi:MAG: protein kinase [Vulcanimicrobiota bacterium]
MGQQPETIGNYKVVRELGRGAMGVVYLCLHPNLGRQVAVKVLPAHIAEEADFLERFRREGEMAARLRHPNIVQVHDFASEAGQYYIVMEFLGSRTLKDGATRSLAEACRLIDQLLSALEHAHENGVVHRDLKPSNILISDRDQVALTDFGIAQSAANQRLTQTGMALGTPEYMAPEQFDGRADARSDLYAVGIILYELLTGFTPFRADTLTEVMKNQLLKTPEPLCEVDFTIPASLSAVVSRALAKKPEDRFQSASEMRQAIGEALRNPQPVPAESVAQTATEPTDRNVTRPVPSKRGRRPAWVPMLLLLVALGVAWKKIHHRRQQQPPAPTPMSTPLQVVVTDTPSPIAVSTEVPVEIPSPTMSLTETPEAVSATPTVEGRVPEEGMIRPGIGVGEVLLGQSEAEVEAAWGPPLNRLENGDKIFWDVGKAGEEEVSFELEFDRPSGKLSEIVVNAPKFSVENFPELSIGTGITPELVTIRLASPSEDTGASLDYDQLGIYFYFANRGMRTKQRFGDHELEFIRVYQPGHSPTKNSE